MVKLALKSRHRYLRSRTIPLANKPRRLKVHLKVIHPNNLNHSRNRNLDPSRQPLTTTLLTMLLTLRNVMHTIITTNSSLDCHKFSKMAQLSSDLSVDTMDRKPKVHHKHKVPLSKPLLVMQLLVKAQQVVTLLPTQQFKFSSKELAKVLNLSPVTLNNLKEAVIHMDTLTTQAHITLRI
jgi:hypothetical protein